MFDFIFVFQEYFKNNFHIFTFEPPKYKLYSIFYQKS